jgi:ATP-binding cassette subfamily B protein
MTTPGPDTATDLLCRLWRHIGDRRKRQFGVLLLLIVAASFAEIFSIGAVIPFLGALTAPEQVFVHSAAQPLIRELGIEAPQGLLLPLTVLFCLAALLSGLLRVLLLWFNTRLSHATGADLSIDIYRRTLYQPYSVHVARNSSEVINGIINKTDAVTHLMNMVLLLCGSAVMLVAILATLLAIDPLVALISFGGFGAIYVGIIRVTRKRLAANGELVASKSNQVVKSLQEGLGGIRDVLLDGSQATYCRAYRDADIPLRQAKASTQFISQSPRTLIEGLGMILIAVMAYILAGQPEGIVGAIPVLGALVLGAQRMLPILQQSYHAWSSIRGGLASLHDVLALLAQPLPQGGDRPAETMSFRHQIELSALSFRYAPDLPYVLNDISLTIPKGARVGFIGATGSGKSTLIDILMGLLVPENGCFAVDGQVLDAGNRRSWQMHIAHVPQTIFLADTSIEENIAFGQAVSEIDRSRVRWAAQQACVAEVIEALPRQYETPVGERGVRLSGGQRQRIGIARALYKRADVIVFDEATSALDNETEREVMRAIEGLSPDLTILVIAHRLSTLKNCTRIVELGNGRILRQGSYSDIIEKTASY